MAVTMPPQAPKPPVGTKYPNLEKMPTFRTGTPLPKIKQLPNRGVKSPPIVAPTKTLNPTSLGRVTPSGGTVNLAANKIKATAWKGKTLQNAAAKRIALGKKSPPRLSIKQKADWEKAVKNNPKGINFAALRKNDKTWKGKK